VGAVTVRGTVAVGEVRTSKAEAEAEADVAVYGEGNVDDGEDNGHAVSL
jgi:hypothetical protein